jgi:hypothetical protein
MSRLIGSTSNAMHRLSRATTTTSRSHLMSHQRRLLQTTTRSYSKQQHQQIVTDEAHSDNPLYPGTIADDVARVHTPMQTHFQNMAAGSTAGVVCCLLFYPLESCEARMQLARKSAQKKSLITTFRETVKNEGVAALYKGVTPTVIGAAWNSAWYMSLYELFKHVVHGFWSDQAAVVVNGVIQYSSPEMLIAAVISGVICTFLSNPFYTMKIRMLTSPHNHGFIQTMKSMYRNEGILSFWKGVVPSLFGVSEGAIQLAVYENLVRMISTMLGGDPSLASMIHFISGAISRAISTLLTYPYQVIRSRLMAHNSPYTGVMDCIRKTKEEGWNGFYGGLLPNLTRQLAPAGVFFMVYNLVKKFFTMYM